MGGWGLSYPNFFWIFTYFLYLQGPLSASEHFILSTSGATPRIVDVSFDFGFDTGRFRLYGTVLLLNWVKLVI